MKRFVIFLCVILLACTAQAEGGEVFQYGGECPHLLKCETTLDDAADAISVRCIRCDAGCKVYRQVEAAHTGVEHYFVLDAQPMTEGVFPQEDNAYAHEARRFWRAVCSDCGMEISFFEELPGTPGGELHSFLPLQESVNFHLPESKQHVYVLQCQVCGYTTGTAVTCLPLDHGLCSTQVTALLNEASTDAFQPCTGESE